MKTDKLIEHTINKRTESQAEKPQAESIVEDWRINGNIVEYKTVMDGWVELGTYDEVRNLDEYDELDDVSEVQSVIEQQWRGDGWNVEYQPVDEDGVDDAFVIPFADPLEPVIVQPALGDDVPEEHTEELEEEYSLFELESMDLITENGDNLVREYDSWIEVIERAEEIDLNSNHVEVGIFLNTIFLMTITAALCSFVMAYLFNIISTLIVWILYVGVIYYMYKNCNFVDSERDYDEYETIYSSSSDSTSTQSSQQDNSSTSGTEYQCMECGCSASESELLIVGDKPFHESSVKVVCPAHTEYGMEYTGKIQENMHGGYFPKRNTGVEVEGRFDGDVLTHSNRLGYNNTNNNKIDNERVTPVVKHKSDELSEDDSIYFNARGRRYKGSVIETYDESENLVLVSVDEIIDV